MCFSGGTLMTTSTVLASVVVVDPHFEDYLPFASDSNQHQVHFIPSAKAALRLAREFPQSLWIISNKLPDFSGLELLEMLEERLGNATVFLVADKFQARDEIRSLCLGAASYLVKPVQAEWLQSWRKQIS